MYWRVYLSFLELVFLALNLRARILEMRLKRLYPARLARFLKVVLLCRLKYPLRPRRRLAYMLPYGLRLYPKYPGIFSGS